jgi:hypothetical protein
VAPSLVSVPTGQRTLLEWQANEGLTTLEPSTVSCRSGNWHADNPCRKPTPANGSYRRRTLRLLSEIGAPGLFDTVDSSLAVLPRSPLANWVGTAANGGTYLAVDPPQRHHHTKHPGEPATLD